MLFAYISFVVACGIVYASPAREHTEAERTRILGPYANIDNRADFTCPITPAQQPPPTSVHQLRPADIKYIGAIGDSLTAANGAGAATILGLLIEYRGLAWSMGGTGTLESTVTLPNVIRKYNPDLWGQSIGNGGQNSTNARYNAARPGAVSVEMSSQANILVNRMIQDLGQTEFENSWKLVTFFIGGNDLCAFCEDPAQYSANNFRDNVKAALDILYARMPRTLVNYVTVLNVAELEDLHEGLICQGLQGFLCDCAINEATRPAVREAVYQYQAATNALIDSGIYDDKDDFTVVRQPFMEHMTVPLTPDGFADFSYFAPDCFHFSRKGHEAAAIELWNNMMEPVGQKTTLWNLADVFHCPLHPQGYIYTSKNSA